MTPSEKLVFDLCLRSALSLWSYASPRRPDGRELCDVLVAFDKDLVVFSIKEIAMSNHADPEIVAKRWTKKAIDESITQLAGARRELRVMERVIKHDGSDGILLPLEKERRLHLIAVAAGAQRKIPFVGGEKDIGYVHVCDETSLRIILDELDTISDFIKYLNAKETYHGSVICEGEENLLAAYLHSGRKLPEKHPVLMLEDGLWNNLISSPEFIRRKSEDRISHWWDQIIEHLVKGADLDSESGPSMTDLERVVRVMAAEDRFQRRTLSDAFLDWLQARQAGARSIKSLSGIVYILATYPPDWNREDRRASLAMRCFVARSPSVTGCTTIIGIATEIYSPLGFSLDAVYLHLPTWTAEDEVHAQEMRSKFKLIKKPIYRSKHFEEYPADYDKNHKKS